MNQIDELVNHSTNIFLAFLHENWENILKDTVMITINTDINEDRYWHAING
tara:strand:- start:131 stop:283 length:153 start_codon:yes stop_codon:yes gene_type:complete